MSLFAKNLEKTAHFFIKINGDFGFSLSKLNQIQLKMSTMMIKSRFLSLWFIHLLHRLIFLTGPSVHISEKLQHHTSLQVRNQ